MTAIPVRRGSLTIQTCDTELKRLAVHIRRTAGDERERLLLDADRWLDVRNEIAEEIARILAQGKRGLG